MIIFQRPTMLDGLVIFSSSRSFLVLLLLPISFWAFSRFFFFFLPKTSVLPADGPQVGGRAGVLVHTSYNDSAAREGVWRAQRGKNTSCWLTGDLSSCLNCYLTEVDGLVIRPILQHRQPADAQRLVNSTSGSHPGGPVSGIERLSLRQAALQTSTGHGSSTGKQA